MLRIARASAVKSRTQTVLQLRNLILTGPEDLREALRDLTLKHAARLLIVAGDNPGRLRSDAALAALCGASPVEASSGQTIRYRLNRGGDRQGNSALWLIANNRMHCAALGAAASSSGRGHATSTRNVSVLRAFWTFRVVTPLCCDARCR